MERNLAGTAVVAASAAFRLERWDTGRNQHGERTFRVGKEKRGKRSGTSRGLPFSLLRVTALVQKTRFQGDVHSGEGGDGRRRELAPKYISFDLL